MIGGVAATGGNVLFAGEITRDFSCSTPTAAGSSSGTKSSSQTAALDAKLCQ